MAWPVIGENFLQTMLGIVDTLLVAQLGAIAIAGVGSALQVMFFVIAALSATSVGSSVLVAQSVGAEKYSSASQVAKQSVIWSVLISIPLVVAGLLLVRPVMDIFGMEPAVTEIGVAYLRVTMGTVVVLTLLILGGGVLRGAGDSRTPMLITALINVINIGLTYALIFGHWGFPAMGTVGSAWATFLSRALGCALVLAVLWRGRNGVSIRGAANWVPDWREGRDILRIGIPAALEQLLISAAFLMLAIVVARLGTMALAAHRIAFNALSLSFLPGIGFAVAATALVGQSVGAGDMPTAAAITRIATLWGMVWMGTFGLVLFFFSVPLMKLFSGDAEVILIGSAGIRTVALAQPFWAILFVQAGALRGTGNTRYPLIVNATAVWTAVLLTAIALPRIGGGLVTVWASFLVVAPITCVLLWWRFRHTVSAGVVPAVTEPVTG